MDTYAVRGDVLLGGELVAGAVVIERGRIVAVRRAPRDGDLPGMVLDAPIVAPGLIDLQVNGGFGAEVGDDPVAIRHLADRLPETGVTAFLPTLITSSPHCYARAFAAFAAARNAAGAVPLGLHLEGPLLSPVRKGAHRRDLIEAAGSEWLAGLPPGDAVRLVTLAPERPEAFQVIRRLRERGVVVSLGHTDATYEAFVAGVDAGATMATHLFNAMSPFVHRAPGAVGAALLDDRVTVGLIADGVHSHPASLRLALRVKGPDRVALVTDMMAAAGMPPGAYALGGQHVASDGASAKLADGTLAGAVVTVDQAVRNVIRWTGTSPVAVLRMATEVPARLLGLERTGRLQTGADADLALFDRELDVQATIVKGRIVYTRKDPGTAGTRH